MPSVDNNKQWISRLSGVGLGWIGLVIFISHWFVLYVLYYNLVCEYILAL